MTGSDADDANWQKHIRPKLARERLADRFRDADDPFCIVIVRDMWLTGFDAPGLHTMYLDKPMQGHSLMQAIARVNHVFRDKPGGLVVDYLGLGAQLRQALMDYTDGGGKGEVKIDQAEDAGDRLAGLWRLLAHSGARIGELLTLQWDTVSWDRQSIAITRSLSIDADRYAIIDTPRTTRGRRVVSLDRDAIEALRRHRARQNVDKLELGPNYTDIGLVFASVVGTAMSERNAIREFKEALERAEFAKEDRARVRLHDLRHFHITEAAHAGVIVKALSARVGHASVAFTLDRYAHAIEAGDRDVADAVSRRLRQVQDDVGEATRTGTAVQ